MTICPLADQEHRSPWQLSLEDLQVVDANFGFGLGVDGVEVRGRMIAVLHRDRDPVELSQAGHGVRGHRPSTPLNGLRPTSG